MAHCLFITHSHPQPLTFTHRHAFTHTPIHTQTLAHTITHTNTHSPNITLANSQTFMQGHNAKQRIKSISISRRHSTDTHTTGTNELFVKSMTWHTLTLYSEERTEHLSTTQTDGHKDPRRLTTFQTPQPPDPLHTSSISGSVSSHPTSAPVPYNAAPLAAPRLTSAHLTKPSALALLIGLIVVLNG